MSQKEELFKAAEAKADEEKNEENKSVVQAIATGDAKEKPEAKKKRPGTKNYRFSMTINRELYDEFTEINRSLGMSSNSILNMLISEYVREKKRIVTTGL